MSFSPGTVLVLGPGNTVHELPGIGVIIQEKVWKEKK